MLPNRKTAIQKTNDQAASSKLYAASKGYYTDPFIKFFSHTKRSTTPEMNIGYYIRVETFRSFVLNFISMNPKAQIINLGAGFDTLSFKFDFYKVFPYKYIEIDLPENVVEKISIIKKNPELRTNLPQNDILLSDVHENLQYHSQDFYHLIAFDLCDNMSKLFKMLEDLKFNFENPTLILAECVFVYIEKEVVDKVLTDFREKFNSLFLLNYEQINMNDKFGQVMIENFNSQGCNLQGLNSCNNSAEDQIKRYKELGFRTTFCWTINQLMSFLTEQCRNRILMIEMVDEPELMKQLFDHYSIILTATSELDRQIILDSLKRYCV